MLEWCSSEIPLLDQVGLFDDLTRVSEKFFSLGGDENALIGALKNRDAEFVFEFVNCGSQMKSCFAASLIVPAVAAVTAYFN